MGAPTRRAISIPKSMFFSLPEPPWFHKSIVAWGFAPGGTYTCRSCSQTRSCHSCETSRSWCTFPNGVSSRLVTFHSNFGSGRAMYFARAGGMGGEAA